MKSVLSIASLAVILTVFSSCQGPKPEAAVYSVKAIKPKDSAAVRVKVSLDNKAVYVLEGDRLLMAAATCIGLPDKPTPKGQFSIFNKIEHKRSGSYGFFISGANIEPGEAAHPKPGRFVGYPMAYWCEFAPGYGFHSGYVHPIPRTHGCLRLQKTVAPKFFSLVKPGTPVSIAQSQPEDLKYGNTVARPTDYMDPDPPAELMISDKAFEKPAGPLLEEL
jgi:hypothetical protein